MMVVNGEYARTPSSIANLMEKEHPKPLTSCLKGLLWIASFGLLLISCKDYQLSPGVDVDLATVADKSDLDVTDEAASKITEKQRHHQEDGGGNENLSVGIAESLAQDKKGSTSNKSKASWHIEESHKWWTPYVAELATTWAPPPKVAVDNASNQFTDDDIEEQRAWCHPVPIGTQQEEELKGLVYIKIPKTSSSTLRGVNHAIAHHIGYELHHSKNASPAAVEAKGKIACEHFDSHKSSKYLDWEEEYQDISLFWTFVRNPISRDISQFYHFSVTRAGADPLSPRVEDALVRYQNAQIQYMSMEDETKVNRQRATLNQEEFLSYLKRRIKSDIIEKYNFIGTVERRMESFAVMSLLWNIDPISFVVLSAKQANGENYDDGKFKGTCFRMVPPPKSPEDAPPLLAKYIQSTNYTGNQADFLLYDVVNESLDWTIASIGVEKVQSRKVWIEGLQAIAEEQCADEAIYPCSKDGKWQPQAKESCYTGDAGCGHACVDRVLQEYRGKHQQQTSNTSS